MFTTLESIIGVLGVLSVVRAAPVAASCNDVQIFIAVGHGETYPGTQRSITSIVCGGRTKCGTTNIDYPSTASGDYCGSVETGIQNGIDSVTAYVTNCPSAKIVLTGWSQGGQVASDIISGGGGVGQGPIAKCTQKTSSGLSPTTAPGKNVVAVTLFGDPRHTAGQSFNAGTAAAKNGSWPREGSQLEAENLWAAKLRSYCADGDIACANGTSTAAHSSYFTSSYASIPAAWITSKLT